MHVLAPLALVLLLSGCLYKTKEVWKNEDYQFVMAVKFGITKEDNEKQLRLAVEHGLILPEYAEYVMKMKWEGKATDWQAQRFIDLAVDETKRRVEIMKALSKASATQSAVQYL